MDEIRRISWPEGRATERITAMICSRYFSDKILLRNYGARPAGSAVVSSVSALTGKV
jgi:hypothetical protein